MAKTYNNAIQLQQGFKFTEPVASDDRQYVETASDLLTIQGLIPNLPIHIEDEDIWVEWNGQDQSIANNFTERLKPLKDDIVALQNTTNSLVSGIGYAIPQSGNTPSNEPVPTLNGIYRAEAGTYTNWGGIVVPNTQGFIYDIQVSNVNTTPVFTLQSTDLNITFDTTPTESSTNAVTSGGVYTQYEYSSIMDISNATGNAIIDFNSVSNIFTIPSGTVLFKDQGDEAEFSTSQSLDCVANSPEQLVKVLFNTLTLVFRVRDYNFVSLEEERVFAYVRKGSSPTVTINCEHSINGVRSYFPTKDVVPTDGSLNAVTSGGVFNATSINGLTTESKNNLWLDKTKNKELNSFEINAIEGINLVQITDALDGDYAFKTITNNWSTVGNRFIFEVGGVDYGFDNPLQVDGSPMDNNGINKILFPLGSSQLYLEIDYSFYVEEIILNSPLMYIDKSTYINKKLIGADLIPTIQGDITTLQTNLTTTNKQVNVNSYIPEFKLTIEDGVTNPKIVFPSDSPLVIGVNNGYYRLPFSTEMEFPSNYSVLCIDIENLPANSNDSVTLVFKTAYEPYDMTKFKPIVSFWNANRGTYIYPEFKQFFLDVVDSIFSDKTLAIMGDSIMMLMRTNFTTLDTQNWDALKNELAVKDLINLGLGGAIVAERPIITDAPLPDDAQETCLPNEFRWLKRLVDAGTREAPDVLMIWIGTNGAGEPNPDNYDSIMALDWATLSDDVLGKVDRSTFYGGLRYTLESIAREWKYCTTIIFTPIQSNPTDYRTYDALAKTGDALKRMGGRYACKVVDALNEIGIIDMLEVEGGNGDWFGDGIHPNAEGKILYKNFTSNKLNVNYFSKK